MFGFPAILVVHAIGMGFLVGASIAMDLRILGFAPGIPISLVYELVPVMRVGFWLNATSGVLLVLAFPIKNFANPVFFLKLSLIAFALLDTSLILRHIALKVSTKGKVLAGISLVLWIGAVVAGRLLFYTYKHLDSSGNPF